MILLTLGFAAVGLRGSLLLKQKFDLNWFLAEDTHLYKFNMERAKFFPDMGQNAGIYFGGLNYSAELPNIHRLVAQLKQEENILKNLEEWYSEFQSYVKLNLKKGLFTEVCTCILYWLTESFNIIILLVHLFYIWNFPLFLWLSVIILETLYAFPSCYLL